MRHTIFSIFLTRVVSVVENLTISAEGEKGYSTGDRWDFFLKSPIETLILLRVYKSV